MRVIAKHTAQRFLKAKAVVESCETVEQLLAARKYVDLADKYRLNDGLGNRMVMKFVDLHGQVEERIKELQGKQSD